MSNSFTNALNSAAGTVKKTVKGAANAVADALPQVGSVKVNNQTNPGSALSMMNRKNAAAGKSSFKIK